MNVEKLVRVTAVTVGLLVVAGIAKAQAPLPWNTNVLQWNAPVGCTPVNIACPAIMNYRVEHARVSSGPWAALGTTAGTVTTYTHTGALAGVNCYRIVALPAGMPPNQASAASAHVCKTNVEPVVQPNPPTDLRFVTEVVAGIGVAPVFTVTAAGAPGVLVGFADVGTKCGVERRMRYREKDYYTPASYKAWVTTSAVVASPCA